MVLLSLNSDSGIPRAQRRLSGIAKAKKIGNNAVVTFAASVFGE